MFSLQVTNGQSIDIDTHSVVVKLVGIFKNECCLYNLIFTTSFPSAANSLEVLLVMGFANNRQRVCAGAFQACNGWCPL
jgi:hypothetical protein